MKRIASVLFASTMFTGCQTVPDNPIPTVDHVEIERFMGDWYVIANIPTFIEKGAHNAVETYALNSDDSIKTTFRFNQDNFDGPVKVYHPTGYIVDRESNAHWGMQFIWPFKSEYRIVYLDENYQHTIIGRSKRDYLWIMARKPQISQKTYELLINKSASLGYDVSKIQPVPQKWTDQGAPSL